MVISVSDFDPDRPIDHEAVVRDIETIVREGFKSFWPSSLTELHHFLSCLNRPRFDIATIEGAHIDAGAIRALLIKDVGALDPVLMQRSVAEALLGMDGESAELLLEGRQVLAGRRYSPGKPVSFHAIRKKPYGQQWKLVTYLATRFIEREESVRLTSFDDTYWDIANERHPPLSAIIREEVIPGAAGIALGPPQDTPVSPGDAETEDRLGYRWTFYQRVLTCSPDVSTLRISTTVALRITRTGTRLFAHRFRTWISNGYRLDLPTVDTALASGTDMTPLSYVGRAPFNASYPEWWLDYFDFGEHNRGDHMRLAFTHTFANPSRELPWHWEAVVPEFDNTDLILEAYLLSDDGTKKELNPPYHATPMRGELYGFLVGESPALIRYQMKNPADWPLYRKLHGEWAGAQLKASNLDYRMRELLKPAENAKTVDKDGRT